MWTVTLKINMKNLENIQSLKEWETAYFKERLKECEFISLETRRKEFGLITPHGQNIFSVESIKLFPFCL
jgi:hypothetical protein